MFFGWTISAAVYKALSFLVAASPCALLVASPVAQAAAVSACSRKGIILSGGAQALERFATAECIAMDKTGTMTEGRMHVSHVEPIAGNTDLCLELGAVLGQFGSGHPVAQGIAQRLKTRVASYRIVPLTVKEVPGLSVSGSVFDPDQNKEYFVTIAKYAPDVQAGLVRYGSTSRISVTSADASELHDCVVSLEDKVRPGVRDAVARCKLPILMLTGDNERNAFKVASDIGIDYSKVFSQLSPQEKAHIVSKKLGNAVMVGDGVNDAPALAAAKAGGVAVAGSAASDSIQSAAVSVADAVIVADDRSNPVDSVSFLVEKSKQTSSLIKSNVGIAIAGIMGTAIAVMIANCPLWLAVLVHEGSTVLVVLNSLRNL
jgi:cation transport ATPase